MFSEGDRQKIQEILGALEGPVTVHFFTQAFECEPCKLDHEMLEALAGLSDEIRLQVHDFQEDQDAAKAFGIDKIPAIVLEGRRRYGVRFFGVPAGYEFPALLEGLIDASRGQADLALETKTLLNTLITPLHLQVFVTPTCPYCPQVVRLAHKMAIHSEKVTSDMVSAMEFPHLAQKYAVMGVPKTVVNDGAVQFEGAMSEAAFVQRVLQAA